MNKFSSKMENDVVSFEDKPVLATMISGGIIISVIFYFVIKWFLSSFHLTDSYIIPLVCASIVMLISIGRSRIVDVLIQIDMQSGMIYAHDRLTNWEGNINAVEKIIVLQRQIQGRSDTIITEFKLYLEVDKNIKYEIPLLTSVAKSTIELLEDLKKK